MTGALEQRLAALEQRVQQLEDEAAVRAVVASYGPLADAGEAAAVAALWEQDGVYDVDELHMTGRQQVAAMVASTAHRDWIARGCAHVVGVPHVRVSGDEAVAVGHSVMLVHGEDGFRVRRATANVWELHRDRGRWRVRRRTSRALDGRPDAPQLLADGMASGD